MRCDYVHRRLDEMNGQALQVVADDQPLQRHLEACQECRRLVEETEQLLQQVRQLPRSLEPERDLWPGIKQRREAEATGKAFRHHSARAWSWHQVLGVAAAVMIGVAVLLGYTAAPRTGSRTRAAAPSPQSTATATHTALGLLGNGSFQATRSELIAALEARKKTLSPETLATVTNGLQVIEDSIRSIGSAVEENPGNPQLAHLLANAYRREIDLLQRAATLPKES